MRVKTCSSTRHNQNNSTTVSVLSIKFHNFSPLERGFQLNFPVMFFSQNSIE